MHKSIIPKGQSKFDNLINKTKLLVSTPLRIQYLLDQFNYTQNSFDFLIIDEADKMLDYVINNLGAF